MYEGQLVRLRAYTKEDLPLALDFINDPEVKRLLVPGIPWPYRLEDEEQWYGGLNPLSQSEYSFAIERIEDHQYLGGCGFHDLRWKDRAASIGIFLGRPFWNQGYGTDAMQVMVRFAFEQMNLHHVLLNVFGFNRRAIRAYEKCGFQVEGVLRQHFFRDGRYHDELIMGILSEEWRGGARLEERRQALDPAPDSVFETSN